ncbi:DUF257 domain-containing protein [Thermococcus thermotolerans]|uniref:DUF257 domain-containing protein n=1 Tax=Thermococcus thermotolerans TaxID=2969672 RepID=UPI002158634A|nr:DUF257 domain-containing protein [Thermococcus thermotolerans]
MSVPDGLMDTLWESLKRGEIVLIERTDSGDQYFGLSQLIRWGNEKGYTVVVVDIFDSLYLLKAKAKLAGINDEIFDKVKAIKIGGKIETGDILGWIRDTSEPVILAKKFEETYEEVLNSEAPLLTVAVGLEKLFVTSEFYPRNIQAIITAISRYVGDERRLSIQFLKAKVIDSSRRSVVDILEDIATTVIRVSRKDKVTEFYVIKSINKSLEGLTIRV